MKPSDVVDHLDAFDMKELQMLNKLFADEIKGRRKIKARRILSQLKKGDRVEVESGKREGFKGKVEKVKRTRVDIKLDNGESWDMPASIIKPIDN